jgi:flagellar biogenesis protein FliO
MIRRLTIASFSLLSAASIAGQDPLGTKADVLSAASSQAPAGGSVWSILQTILVLGVVLFVLKAFGPKLIAKFSRKLVTSTSGQIKVEESATFAGGSLYVVEARGKSLLLCVGANGVTCLSELESKPSSLEQPLFMEIVDQEIETQIANPRPVRAAVYLEETEEPEKPVVTNSLLRNPEIQQLRKRQSTVA